MMRAARPYLLSGVALLLAAACSSGAPVAGAPSDVGTIRAQGDAVAEVPEVVVADPPSRGSSGRPTSYAYVTESNRLVLLDHARRRVAPDLELAAVPQEIAAGKGTLVLAFASGDLALIDVGTRRQVGRASLTELKDLALGGDVILDEVQVAPNGIVWLAGRIADKATGDYRSFLQERDEQDLSLLRERILPPSLGVVQDLALEPTGSMRLLLSDGRVYDPRTDKTMGVGAGEDSQVLRYGPEGDRWVGSGGARPGILTPQDAFVPIASGRVTGVVPVTAGLAAVLVSQPPQVWLVSSAGKVLTRTDVDDYPYAGALVGDRLHVGSVNGDWLQVLHPTSGAAQQRLKLGQGIVAVGRLRSG